MPKWTAVVGDGVLAVFQYVDHAVAWREFAFGPDGKAMQMLPVEPPVLTHVCEVCNGSGRATLQRQGDPK